MLGRQIVLWTFDDQGWVYLKRAMTCNLLMPGRQSAIDSSFCAAFGSCLIGVTGIVRVRWIWSTTWDVCVCQRALSSVICDDPLCVCDGKTRGEKTWIFFVFQLTGPHRYRHAFSCAGGLRHYYPCVACVAHPLYYLCVFYAKLPLSYLGLSFLA